MRRNALSAGAFEWYLGYLAAIDDKDVEAYGAHLADDCTMIQNNQTPVEGKAVILAGLNEYWKTFASLEHELLEIVGDDRAFALEAWNHYVRLDGGRVSVRAVALTDRDVEGKVTRFAFYTDVSPVFSSKDS